MSSLYARFQEYRYVRMSPDSAESFAHLQNILERLDKRYDYLKFAVFFENVRFYRTFKIVSYHHCINGGKNCNFTNYSNSLLKQV